jgi:hypothetical protein
MAAVSIAGAITGAGYAGGPISGTTGTFSGALTSPTIDALDTRIDAVEADTTDTGWLSTGVGFTAATGWSLGGYQVRRRNGMVGVQITVTRTGASLAAGNIGNVAVVNLPAGWIPDESNGQLGAGASGPDHSTYASTSGALIMSNTDVGIATTGVVQLMGCYML